MEGVVPRVHFDCCACWHQHRRGNSGGVGIGKVEKGWFGCLPSELTRVAVDGLVFDVITELTSGTQSVYSIRASLGRDCIQASGRQGICEVQWISMPIITGRTNVLIVFLSCQHYKVANRVQSLTLTTYSHLQTHVGE